MVEYNYPEHNWNTPEKTVYDEESNPYCKKHNLLLMFNSVTLSDYCPACSYQPECNHPRCFCHLLTKELEEKHVTIDQWKAPHGYREIETPNNKDGD